MQRWTLLLLTSACVLLALPVAADAQLDRLRRLGDRAVETAESTLSSHIADRIEGAMQCALGDDACAEEARANGERPVFVDDAGNVITDADGNPITDPEDAAAAAAPPGDEVWTNYDFVPGSQVVYALDLSAEPIGRWPARQLIFDRGAGQVVELNGARAVEFTDRSRFRIQLPDSLPDDFTVEVGFQAGTVNMPLQIVVDPPEGQAPFGNRADRDYLVLSGRPGIYRRGNDVSATPGLTHISSEIVSFGLQVDGDPTMPEGSSDYVILYAGTDRVALVPNANMKRGRALEFHVRANSRFHAYLTHLVVATHGDPLYDALTTGDRSWTTRGILFDFDSDRLRGESTPTLDELRRVLEDHGDLSVTIEGHTDSAGDDAYNQALSERRAQAVVDYLVEAGIDASRLDSAGMGESHPVGENDTEAGRQQNRRVVIRAAGD
ncbi:MAG: OmpA family protein [Gemmatimonadota bacterium]